MDTMSSPPGDPSRQAAGVRSRRYGPRLASLRWLPILPLVGAVVVTSCSREATSAFPSPTNVLLITIDTLRADHLSGYGYPRRTSPLIDHLAAEGVRFHQATVQWPKTGPSFASLFTATYPKDNQIVRRVGKPIPHGFRMLAEILRGHGYTTCGVVSNGALASELNFDQGFDTYVEAWKLAEPGGSGYSTRAARVTELAQAAAEKLDRTQPYFFWVHYIDPHFPYAPPEPWRERFQGDKLYDAARKVRVNKRKRRGQMLEIGRKQVLDGRTELDFYIARYDAEIAYTDAHIGLLLDSLRDQGLLENTLTILTSDHGESLGDHYYYFSHGRFGFQAGLRVPLIFHYPGVLSAKVVPEPVELIHLAPTILEAAGVPLEDGRWMQGRSLLPRLLAESHPPERPSYAYSEAGNTTNRKWQKVVRDQRFKLIHVVDRKDQRWIGGLGQRFALFDLKNDPEETVNVAEQHPREFKRLKRALHHWWNEEAFAVRVDPPGADEPRELDEKTRQQLRALGYLR